MMTKKKAFEFLEKNQPFPEDESVEFNIKKFNEIRIFFIENNDPLCVPLFLNCFGEGSGFGIYQTIEDLVAQYDDELVIMHLNKALFSQYAGVRYWCAQIAQNYKDTSLINGLIYSYKLGGNDSKCASLIALSNYDDLKVIDIANDSLKEEVDDGLLQEIASDILKR